jgi:cytochrome c
MYKLSIFLFLIVVFSACDKKHTPNLNGKKLLEQKCSICHNLDLPPQTFEDEKAPPMMAVSFHIKDFIEATNDSEKIPKAIDFVKDYVINPSETKSFCDKKSLETYGVMPSQKGNVTQDELEAIARYMFSHYNVKNLNEAQALKNKLSKMPKGKRVAIKYNCLGCHKIDKDLVGPSFKKIATRYKDKPDIIKHSIQDGSSKKWNSSHGALMPHFKDKISDNDIDILTKWISLKK